MKFSNREKILGTIVLLLAAFYLYDRTLLEPIRVELSRLQAENEQMSIKIESNQERLETEKMIKQEVGELDYNRDMTTMLPASPMASGAIAYVTECAGDKNVSLRFISCTLLDSPSISPPSKAGPIIPPSMINFQLSAEGNYYDLLSFLLDIENAPRIYRINHSNLTLADTTSEVEPGSDDILVPDLQAVGMDYNHTVLNLDFNTFYDQPSAITWKL
jgi:hypothetical protein